MSPARSLRLPYASRASARRNWRQVSALSTTRGHAPARAHHLRNRDSDWDNREATACHGNRPNTAISDWGRSTDGGYLSVDGDSLARSSMLLPRCCKSLPKPDQVLQAVMGRKKTSQMENFSRVRAIDAIVQATSKQLENRVRMGSPHLPENDSMRRSSRLCHWRPQGDSNPRRRRERAVSWASRRWGQERILTRLRMVEPGRIELPTSTMPLLRSPS